MEADALLFLGGFLRFPAICGDSSHAGPQCDENGEEIVGHSVEYLYISEHWYRQQRSRLTNTLDAYIG